MNTVTRMQRACADVDRKGAGNYLVVCADVADKMVANVQRMGSISLIELAGEMRANSERWFPDVHKRLGPDGLMDVFYALGLAGEAGEVANLAKKKLRGDGVVIDPGELADVFTYLVLLADECGVDLIAAYEAKREECDGRWGRA